MFKKISNDECLVEFFDRSYLFNSETIELEKKTTTDESHTLNAGDANQLSDSKEYYEFKRQCRSEKINSITIIVTNKCNMSCIYCYGKYDRPKKTETIGIDDLKKIIVLYSDGQKSFHLSFFGGEPLVEFRKIKQCVEFCENLKENTKTDFHYSIVTNGTLINDSVCQLLHSYRFSVTISFDGMPTIQNKQRALINGKNSFNKVNEGIDLLNQYGIKFHIRATITKKFIDYYLDNILFVEKKYNKFPGVQLDATDKWCIDDVYNIEHQLNNFLDQCIDDKEYFKLLSIPKLYAYFKMLVTKKKDYTICEAGISSVCLSSDRNYYICHRFDNHPDTAVGNIESGIDYKKLMSWREINRWKVDECRHCLAKYFCGFGCPSKNNYQPNNPNNTNQIFCEFERMYVRLALKVYVFFKEFEPRYIDELTTESENESFKHILSKSISKLQSELVSEIKGVQ